MKRMSVFISLLLVTMIPLYAQGENTPEQPTYESIFGRYIATAGFEKPAITRTDQEKLYAFTKKDDQWSGDLIPAQYLSESPEDVGGIVIITEKETEVAKYTNGAKAYGYFYAVWLVDPFTDVLVNGKTFKYVGSAPSTTYANVRLYPDEESITAWIYNAWHDYLLANKTTEETMATASDFSYGGDQSSGLYVGGYQGEGKRIVIPSAFDDGKIIMLTAKAFYENEDIISVVISNGVTSIGQDAFAECKFLTYVSLPHGVAEIGTSAFRNCVSLTGVVIPETMTAIENATFSGCTSLQNVLLPDTMTSIGSNAFLRCENLRSITIPKSVTSIGFSTFDHCNELTLIVTEGSYAEAYAKENGIPYTFVSEGE